jgi:hypothetical protein
MTEKLKQIAVYDQHADYEYEYDDYMTEMRIALENIGTEWDITVHNGNWKGQTGTLTSDDVIQVSRTLLMDSGQCVTEISIGEEDNTLEGVCYHHDSPTGSRFYIKGNGKHNTRTGGLSPDTGPRN